MRVTVADLRDVLEEAFPAQWAEPWDRVGLLAGDPAAEVRGVLVTLDPTVESVSRAVDVGANVLLTHHPAFLEAPERPLPGSPKGGGALFAALHSQVSLLCAHTNLDRAPRGADSLPEALGLPDGEPLESSLQPVSHITVYGPAESEADIASAMSAAGAGRIGEYRESAFSSAGVGSYRVPQDGEPYQGMPGEHSHTSESRLEMVCDPAAAAAVVARAAAAHPYEEPLVVVTPGHIARGAARMGRVTGIDPVTLAHLAGSVGTRLGCVPRVWGTPERTISRVATATGSGGSLIADALRVKADVLVTGEVRYHDALDAMTAGLAIIEAGHDMTEWPLVPVLADAVRTTAGIDPARVVVDEPARRWWTP